jgi:succinate dehydrogenase / fumarate reductase cytochrome b subunit
MSWLKRTFNSSVGGKFVVGLTGLGLCGFLLGHLSGNLLVYGGPEAINAYAEGLRKFPALLWTMRIGIIITFLLHLWLTLRLNLHNKAARPEGYAVKSYRKASFSSRTMVQTGLLTLLYIAFHLAQFTFRVTSPEIGAFGHYDVYQMLIFSFHQPLNVILYIAALIVLGLHLSHGISSMFQSLGINHPKYNKLLRLLGPGLSTVIVLLYISIPVSILLGVVK